MYSTKCSDREDQEAIFGQVLPPQVQDVLDELGKSNTNSLIGLVYPLIHLQFCPQ
jgi:hypothetical protein